MAISVLMNGSNHSMSITQPGTIRQRDSGDYIYFVLPTTVAEGTIDQTTTVTAKYLTPGNVLYTQLLSCESAVYKEGYLRYPMQINTNLTGVAGKVHLQLSVVDSGDDGVCNFKFTSGEVVFDIEKTNAAFSNATEGGTTSVAVNLSYDSSTNALRLVDSDGSPIGSGVTLNVVADKVADSANDEDGIINVLHD